MIRSAANQILDQANENPDQPPPPVGSHFVKRWLGRHPEYYKRRQKTMELERTAVHEPKDIEAWFHQYRDVIEIGRASCRERV